MESPSSWGRFSNLPVVKMYREFRRQARQAAAEFKLWIGNTRVTDAGLAHLKGLRNLLDLSVGNTQVTDAGVAELKQTLPDLQVVR